MIYLSLENNIERDWIRAPLTSLILLSNLFCFVVKFYLVSYMSLNNNIGRDWIRALQFFAFVVK